MYTTARDYIESPCDSCCDQTMPALTYLFRQDGRYYFRRRIPQDLVVLIRKAEIKISLGACASLRDAQSAVVYLTARHQIYFDRLRTMAKGKDLLEENTDLKKAVDNLLDENDRLRTAHGKHSNNLLEMAKANFEVEKEVNEHLVEVHETHELDKASAVATAKDEQFGANTETILSALSSGIQPSTKPVIKLPTVSEFLPTYLGEKSKKWSAGYESGIVSAIELFIKITGDKSLSDYVRNDIVNYMGILELVHSSYGKSGSDADLTIDEILKVGKNKEKRALKTLLKHFRSVKGLFRNAKINHGGIDLEHLFDEQEFSSDVKQTSQRIPWEIDDLNKLFQTPIWTGTSKRKESLRYNAGERIIRDSYWWLPVIGLFTGMRLEEICQLQANDLKSEGDIIYLDLNFGDGKRLKNTFSARQVPIHSRLIDLGLLNLFTSKKGTQRLFPELKPGGKDNKYGYDYTGHFTQYRRKTDTYKKWRDFHSFRHTFVSEMGDHTNHNMVLIRSIVGHGSKSQTEDYTHIDLQTKANAMTKLVYDGLVIKHLLRWSHIVGQLGSEVKVYSCC